MSIRPNAFNRLPALFGAYSPRPTSSSASWLFRKALLTSAMAGLSANSSNCGVLRLRVLGGCSPPLTRSARDPAARVQQPEPPCAPADHRVLRQGFVPSPRDRVPVVGSRRHLV